MPPLKDPRSFAPASSKMAMMMCGHGALPAPLVAVDDETPAAMRVPSRGTPTLSTPTELPHSDAVALELALVPATDADSVVILRPDTGALPYDKGSDSFPPSTTSIEPTSNRQFNINGRIISSHALWLGAWTW